MRSVRAGNIADNAYLVAELLRRRGEDAQAFHFRIEANAGQSEWVEAAFASE